MSIETLLSLLRPPDSPRENQGDWLEAERRIGTPLPSDYRAFIGRFGSGAIDDFLYVLNPFAVNPHLSLFVKSEAMGRALHELRRDFPEGYPYDAFPQESGLLCIAFTDNGDGVFWKTGGAPLEWTIASSSFEYGDTESFSMNLTDFLSAVLSGVVHPAAFPPTFPSRSPSFRVARSG